MIFTNSLKVLVEHRRKKRQHIFYYSITYNRYWHESSPPGHAFQLPRINIKKRHYTQTARLHIIILIMYDSYKQLTATAIVAFMLIIGNIIYNHRLRIDHHDWFWARISDRQ